MKALLFIKKIVLNKWIIIWFCFTTVFVVASNIYIESTTNNRIFSTIEKVPYSNVALLLGTSRYSTTGQNNLYFQYRIKAAVRLYNSGKIRHIIVSGDNSLSEYNEPREMRRALVKEGIPIEAITLDFAGFRTLDSVVRCKKVFGQDYFIIVSQKFHIERALFIAEKFHINAIGFAAKSPTQQYSIKTTVREYFARAIAMVDVYLLQTQPKFLGKQEKIVL